MRVAYVTPYYNGACDGRYGRFHDWIHTARDMDSPPFEFDVLPFTVSNPDETLGVRPGQFLGDAESLWGTKQNKLEFLLNAPRIRNALRERAYDLVHVLVLDAIVYPTTLSAVGDVPLVVGPDIAGWSPVRDVPYWEETRAQRIKNRLRYRFKNALGNARRYDHAIAFGRHHRDILESFSIPGDRITVLEAGVDRKFGRSSDEAARGSSDVPELLYVGDFSEYKGYPLFLRAVARLDVSVTVRVVGAGDPNRELIRSLGLEDVVSVEGFVPRAELPRYYEAADLYVVPSIDETAGTNTQIEALASGTPVVVTEAPGLDEYAPEDAVVFVERREPAVLRAALETALENLESLTEAARDKAPDYLADRPVEQLDGVYRDLVTARSA
jgi:glycosyltransferase involved in cell wall biosynthesis